MDSLSRSSIRKSYCHVHCISATTRDRGGQWKVRQGHGKCCHLTLEIRGVKTHSAVLHGDCRESRREARCTGTDRNAPLLLCPATRSRLCSQRILSRRARSRIFQRNGRILSVRETRFDYWSHPFWRHGKLQCYCV